MLYTDRSTGRLAPVLWLTPFPIVILLCAILLCTYVVPVHTLRAAGGWESGKRFTRCAQGTAGWWVHATIPPRNVRLTPSVLIYCRKAACADATWHRSNTLPKRARVRKRATVGQCIQRPGDGRERDKFKRHGGRGPSSKNIESTRSRESSAWLQLSCGTAGNCQSSFATARQF